MEEYLVRQYLAGFASKAKKPLHTGVRTELHDLISLSACLSVYDCVCVTVVLFTDCESCATSISTHPCYGTAFEGR